jgi:hypothetical protein
MSYTVLCCLTALGRLGLCGTRGTYPRVSHDASEILASGTVGLSHVFLCFRPWRRMHLDPAVIGCQPPCPVAHILKSRRIPLSGS